MRIYLAGLIGTGAIHSDTITSERTLLTKDLRGRVPWELESYHYIRGKDTVPEYFRRLGKSIFLDSGAFSMFTQGAHVDLAEYADYIKTNQDWIHIASNVDEIGKGKEAESYRNQKQLEKLLGPDLAPMLCPVHHARDDDKWLQKYLAEGYEYIFLGGMVPESTAYLKGWLDHVWCRYLVRRDGTAKIKVHGFGMTTFDLIQRYPWFSVDSTSWVMGEKYGTVYIDWPDGRVINLDFAETCPSRYAFDKHYDTIAPRVKEHIDARLQELGYDPELLRTNYGWRDHCNISFFMRYGANINPVFIPRQKGVFD
jgi:hypothetical protein